MWDCSGFLQIRSHIEVIGNVEFHGNCKWQLAYLTLYMQTNQIKCGYTIHSPIGPSVNSTTHVTQLIHIACTLALHSADPKANRTSTFTILACIAFLVTQCSLWTSHGVRASRIITSEDELRSCLSSQCIHHHKHI